MIIDAHAHVSETDYGNFGILREQLGSAGVDGAVLVPGGMMDVRRMTDYVTGRAEPESTIPNNRYVSECLQGAGGQFTGFACVDPHGEEPVVALEAAFTAGFRGLKLSPMTHQFSFESRAAADLAALCGEYGYPVYSHVLYSPGASTARFVALARQFPGTAFILGHMGFGPADQEGLEAAIKFDNFFLETSTGNFLHLKAAFAKAGPTKLIFGSEFPLSHPGAELEKIRLLDARESALDRILAGNISGLTGWSPAGR